MKYPLGYLITFTTYGTWLHGDERGSVDKEHSRYGGVFVPPNRSLNIKEKIALKNPSIALDQSQRETALDAILGVCSRRDWFAHVVHVRQNHVHIVVTGPDKPEKMMSDFKAYATRALRQCGDNGVIKKYWTHHGSTKYLCTKESLASAIEYVKYEQGKMMAFGSTQSRSPERK